MQPLNTGNEQEGGLYREQVELERWSRSTGAGRNLGNGWEKGASSYLCRKLADVYLRKVDEIYDSVRHKIARYATVADLFNDKKQVRQVAMESFLYVMGNLGDEQVYNRLCASIGKRAEYALWLTHPKWGKSWHLDGLRLASHNDLGMTQIMSKFQSEQFKYNIDYVPLTPVQKVAIGAFFVEAMALGTRMIKIESVQRPRKNRFVRPTELYWDFLGRWKKHIILFRPLYMPMIEPPRPYTEHSDGGYFTITTPCSSVDWSEFNPLIKKASPVVMGSLNRLQAEPFRLDRDQIQLQTECWSLGHAIGDLPSRIRMDEPAAPVGEKRTRDEWKLAWAYKADQKRNAIRSKFVHALVATDRIAQYDRLWFVWQMDHRGRLYPRGSQINFASGDVFRSMLQFDKRSPVQGHERELSWHLGCAYGLKPDSELRWQWLLDNRDLIKRIGESPLENLAHWGSAKEPWRFVQVCRDWAGFMADPSYETGTVFRLDQTSSGFGHVACLVRDERMAQFTNVIGDRPSDLYVGVSRLARQHIEQVMRGEKDQKTRNFLEWWLANWPERPMWKKIVMPVVYGRTFITLRDQLTEYLRDDLENFLTEEGYRIFELSNVFAKAIHAYLKILLPGATQMAKWLGLAANAQLDMNMRPSWLTPNEMLVQSYRTMGSDSWLTMTLPITGRKITFHTVDHLTGVLDKKKCKRQLGADFVHSMDAAFLHQFVCHWGDTLAKPIVTIHDCFGTTLENSALLRKELCRKWGEFYSEDYLERHRQWVHVVTGLAVPPPPMVGTLDTERIGENPFLFS